MALIVFLLAATALLAGVRWAAPAFHRRRLAAYGLLAGGLFAPAMVGPWRQLPLDIAAALPPYADDPGAPPALAVQNPLLSDVVTQMLPFRAEVREAWTHGALPLWSHRLGTGQPLLANPQTAALSPLHLVTLGLDPTRGMSVAAALQLVVLLAGADLLALALGATAVGAVLAALVAGGSSFHLVWLYHPLGMAFAWVPLFLAGVLGLARATPRAAALAVAATFGMLASGQPQIALYAIFAGGLVWTWGIVRGRSGNPALPRRVIGTVGAAALSAALCAPLVLPTLASLSWSERALLLAADAGALHPLQGEASLWLPVLDPFTFGSPRDGNWSGPWNYNEVASAWAGTLPTALALAAALVATGLPRRLVVAGLLALALAHRMPPFDAVADLIPGLAATTTGRLRLFWPLVVALAAALALGELRRSRRLRIVGAALLVGLALLLASGVTRRDLAVTPPAQQVAHAAAIAIALLGAALLVLGARYPRVAPILLVLLAAGELLLVGGRYHPWVDERLAQPPAAVAALAARADSGHGERITAFGGRLLPYEPARFGLADPRGFDPLRPAASLQLLRRRLHRPAHSGYFLVRPEAAAEPLLDRLAVGLALGPPELAGVPGWREVERFGATAMLRNDEALPLVFVAGEKLGASGPEEALALASAGAQPARRVYVETAGESSCPVAGGGVAGVGGSGGTGGVGAGGEADPTTELLANGLRVRRSAAENPVLLATSVSFMPGWTVAAPSAGARLCRVDGAFLALAVDARVDEVELQYRPPLWGATLGLFATGVAGAVTWPLLARRRNRGRAA